MERKKTPDSEALTSSDEERDFAAPIKRVSSQPWGREIPGLGRPQPRSSFDSLGLDRSGIWGRPQPLGNVPEESVSHGSQGKIPFAYPLQPVMKNTRSQSYSVGQLDDPSEDLSASAEFRPANLVQRPTLYKRGSQTRFDDSQATRRGHPPLSGGRPAYRRNDSLSSRHEAHTPRTETAGGDVSYFEAMNQWDAPATDTGSVLEKSWPQPFTRPHDLTPGGQSTGSQGTAMPGALLSNPDAAADYFGGPRAPPRYDDSTDGAGRGPKGMWQSSLGFGNFPEPPQSRRHSLADVPARPGVQLAVTSAPMAASIRSPLHRELTSLQVGEGGPPRPGHTHDGIPEPAITDNQSADARYFSGQATMARLQHEAAEERRLAEDQRLVTIETSPRGTFGPKILYAVAFKCDRIDIYHVPDSVGLRPKVGDMVIVDGDRGTDLGCVTAAGISVEEAKAMKEKSTQNHIRWLLMFSRKFAGANQIRAPEGLIPGAVPSDVESAAQQIVQRRAEVLGCKISELELRPKLIRRIANAHEVTQLQEKEGMEAKSRRVCQTKVDEYNLEMEVLDCEFQADYRKLTFYYYAEKYIDFNTLVNALFRAFKTRIWMSAINPASFAIMAEQRAHRNMVDERRRVEEEATRFHNYPAFFHQAFDAPPATNSFYGQFGPPALPFGSPYQNYAGFANGQGAPALNANAPPASFGGSTHPAAAMNTPGPAHVAPSHGAASFAPVGQQSPGIPGRIAFGSFPSSLPAAYAYPNSPSHPSAQSAETDLEDVQKHLRGLGIGKEPSFGHGPRQGSTW